MTAKVKRRAFITLLGGAAAASILGTQRPSAQQTRPVIGILGRTTAEEYTFLIAAFRKGLTETGYVEGQNVTIEYRWADNHDDRLEAMASGAGQKSGLCHFHKRWDGPRAGRKGCNLDDPDRLCERYRPGPLGTRCQHQPTERQCHGRELPRPRGCQQADINPARADPERQRHRSSGEPR